MNSESESDWDSMSEAPPLHNTKTSQDTRTRINSQQHLHTRSQEDSKDRGEAPVKQKVRKSRDSEDATSHQDQMVETRRGNEEEMKKRKAKIPVPAKRVPSSKDSGIDTSTVCSSNLTPASVRGVDTTIRDTADLKGDVLEVGFVNKGIEEDSDDMLNENSLAKLNFKPYPDPEEKISLLHFEEIKTKYFQIEFEDEGLLADKAIPSIVTCSTKVSAEILGLFKIPLVLVFVLIGQIIRAVTSSILRPASDYILKPILVSLHNLILSHLFSLFYNISSMVAITLSPCCPVSKYSPLWSYSQDKEQHLPV